MTSFNRHEFPPGGWTFFQPQTAWRNPMAMVGFDASVKAIIAHRKANPAVTAKCNLTTDYHGVANELERYTKLRLGIPDPPPAPSFFQASSSRLPSRVVAVAADIKTAARGTAVVLDWLTSGGAPVAQELANRRASVCIECPQNVEGAWFTVAPAELIRATLSARSDLKLETPFDDRLKSCNVCKCLNRLKPWCPLPHIIKGTPPDIMAAFPANCWIKCESASVTSA